MHSYGQQWKPQWKLTLTPISVNRFQVAEIWAQPCSSNVFNHEGVLSTCESKCQELMTQYLLLHEQIIFEILSGTFDCLQAEYSRAQAFVVRVHSVLYEPFGSIAYHYFLARCFYLIAPLLQSLMSIQKNSKHRKITFQGDKAFLFVHVHNDLCCCCLHSSMAGWLYLLLLAYLITTSSRTSCFLVSFILIAYFDICTF